MFDNSVEVKKRPRAAPRAPRAAGGAGGGASALGNNTKSQAAFRGVTCPETGVVTTFALDSGRREYVEKTDEKTSSIVARNARYSAQTAASKLLFNHVTPRDTQWRVTGCTRRKVGEEVAILYSPSVKKAHYGGLMICGSVWTCPNCAAKISERRKAEIQQATDFHKESGGALYMITFTFSHQRNDVLAPMLKAFSSALKNMREHRRYKSLKQEMEFVGEMRTLEVTYGDANGFHPHQHCLWLTKEKLTRAQQRKLTSVLFTLWHRACILKGLSPPNRKRGVDVKEMDTAADYMAKMGREPKWGVASELTKQHVKVGKAGSMTPFDLLRAYESGEKRFGPLFIQYAEAFFGKRQVVWSAGLKKAFGIDEISDEELAEQQEEDAEILIRLDVFDWKVVLKQPYDRRALLLDLAESGGFQAVRLYVDRLKIGECPF